MIDMQTGLPVGRQVAPNGANICYGILSCYKQVALTERMIDKFSKD